MGKIRPYAESDYPELKSWFNLRELPAPKPSQLPKTGYFVPGVAAGFVYMTDSSMCMLDVFIAHPSSEEGKRDAALNLITMHLINYARTCGCDLIVCTTKSKAIEYRAEKFGFKSLGHETVLTRSL